MATAVDQERRTIPVGQIIARGFAAGHGALLGAVLLFLLQAPAQVLNAVAQGIQGQVFAAAGQQPDPKLLILYVSLALGSFALALGVFFLFPLVQGGILGQHHDRLESPRQPLRRFSTCGRAFYVRLLGSEALFALVMVAILMPVMCLGAALSWQHLAFQQMATTMPDVSGEGSQPPQSPDPQQLTRQVMTHPAMLVGMVLSCLLMSAVSMVYWVANSIVVAERERVIASWRKALHFCRQNFTAVLGVWLLIFAVGVLIFPFGVAGQLGIVKDLRALVGLALMYSAVLGYWGMRLAGLVMSLYLACRPPSAEVSPGPSAAA